MMMMTMTKALYLLRWTLMDARGQADETSQNGIPSDPRQDKEGKERAERSKK